MRINITEWQQKPVADVENNEELLPAREPEVSASEPRWKNSKGLNDFYLKARATDSGFNDFHLKAKAMICSDCLICAESARQRYLSKEWIDTEDGRPDSGDDSISAFRRVLPYAKLYETLELV